MVCPKLHSALPVFLCSCYFFLFFSLPRSFFVGQFPLVNYLFDSLLEHPIFSALASSFIRRETPSAKQSREKISVTSAVNDQPKFILHIRRSNERVFEWISCECMGKYSGRRFEERMGSFRVWKTQQASTGSLLTCCWIKERCFRESSNRFRNVCSISGFAYCVFLCGTNSWKEHCGSCGWN